MGSDARALECRRHRKFAEPVREKFWDDDASAPSPAGRRRRRVRWRVPATAWFLLVTLAALLPATLAGDGEEAAATPGGTSLRADAAANGQRNPSDDGLCYSMDIRNKIEAFNMLSGCRVVEGFVHIVLLDNKKDADFDNVTFPGLREITRYLLLYRVSGLRSLRRLFPNLTVIRGAALFRDYALVVYELFALRELGFGSLALIERGGVRIEKNSHLCFTNTVDWARLAPAGQAVLSANGGLDCAEEERRICEKSGCPVKDEKTGTSSESEEAEEEEEEEGENRRMGCWGRELCQRALVDNAHCHPECLGGCSGPGPADCYACKHVVSLDGSCVERCPPSSYLFRGRRCVTAAQCAQMRDVNQATLLRQRQRARNATASPVTEAPQLVADGAPPDGDVEVDVRRFWVFNGSCVDACPQGYEEAVGGGSCLRCQGRCRRECKGAVVDSLAAAQQLRGCTYVDGALIISLPAGGAELLDELRRSLSDIEEIADYLKVWHSFSLLSLDFLSRLRIIGGRALKDRYALKVVENQNLRSLWNWTDNQGNGLPLLRIMNGSVLFHGNPKLCRTHIDRLLDVAGLNASLQVIQSNGDHEVCQRKVLRADVSHRLSHGAVVTWQPLPPQPAAPAYTPSSSPTASSSEPSMLGYLVYFTEAPERNVSRSSGTEACGAKGWRVIAAGRADALEERTAPMAAPVTGSFPVAGHVFPNVSASIPAAPSANHEVWLTAPLTKLKPYTQYAFYVTTYSVTSSGGSSDIQYFTTLPARPSMPPAFSAEAVDAEETATKRPRLSGRGTRKVFEPEEEFRWPDAEDSKAGEEVVRLRWLPPVAANGLLKHYVVRGAELADPLEPDRDYCAEPPPTAPPTLPPAPLWARSVKRVLPRCRDNSTIEDYDDTPETCECNIGPEALLTSQDFMKHCSNPSLSIDSEWSEECSRFVQDTLEARPMLIEAGELQLMHESFPDEEKEEEHEWRISKESSSQNSKKLIYFEYEVPVNATGLWVRGLPPFVRLQLALSACREPSVQPRSACSAPALTVVRTRARPSADTIARPPVLVSAPLPASATSTLAPAAVADGKDEVGDDAGEEQPQLPPPMALWARWQAPARPNAEVLLYHLEWRRTDRIAHVDTQCVTAAAHAAFGGAPLPGAAAAALRGTTAEARVRARSRGGLGAWTAWSAPARAPAPRLRPGSAGGGSRGEDEDGGGGASDREVNPGLLAALSIAIIAVTACVGCAMYRMRMKRRHLRHLFATVNPDYGELGVPLYDESWEVAPERVRVLRELGRGSFGRVMEAVLMPAPGATGAAAEPVHCAAKAVAAAADGNGGGRARAEALNEAAAMKAFREGAHLVRLLGVVSSATPPLVLMELMPRGDLKRVLRAARAAPPRRRPRTRHLLAAAAQVADGMAFLEAHKFVHRDLAARNCMVAANGVVKVGDFGMARDVYETDYYRNGARGLLPVRWMAPESLADGVFSARSDVWAFGVVLWEAATLAQQPYQGLANEQVLDLVLSGGTLAPPTECPGALARLMSECWRWRPSERPAFLRLVALLEDEASAAAAIEAGEDEPLWLAMPLEAIDEAGEDAGGEAAEEEEEEEEGRIGEAWALGGGAPGAAGALEGGLPPGFRERSFAHSPAGRDAAAAAAEAEARGARSQAPPAMPRSRFVLPQEQEHADWAMYVAPRGGESERLLLPSLAGPSTVVPTTTANGDDGYTQPEPPR